MLYIAAVDVGAESAVWIMVMFFWICSQDCAKNLPKYSYSEWYFLKKSCQISEISFDEVLLNAWYFQEITYNFTSYWYEITVIFFTFKGMKIKIFSCATIQFFPEQNNWLKEHKKSSEKPIQFDMGFTKCHVKKIVWYQITPKISSVVSKVKIPYGLSFIRKNESYSISLVRPFLS